MRKLLIRVGLGACIGLIVILSACASQPQPTRIAQAPAALEPAATETLPPTPTATLTAAPTSTPTPTVTPSPTPVPNPLSVEFMRKRDYPGSDIVVEQTLAPGANYYQYVVSYKSDGLKIYALMTVPMGPKPATGWPVVIFNHGYIPPAQYRTTERYVAYVAAFARSGYIVFKSDYRGHGDSEGRASGGYGSPDYTIDVLNAVGSIKRYKDADPKRIGMWGHSMGGSATLRAMVVSKDIRAGVIWAGVVASYPDLISRWRRPAAGNTPTPVPNPTAGFSRRWRDDLVAQYGTPDQNPVFWASISPNSYLRDLSGPIQLHHGTADAEVPLEFSETLYKQIQDIKGAAELYIYPGDEHNITASFNIAMPRSVQFMDKYVKGQ